MSPRVSVVIPTRDRRASLERALASVDAQDFRDFEVLVVDDGSTDGTAEWLRGRLSALTALETAFAGAAAARNEAVRRARGELIAFLDDDDLWRPDFLAAQVARLDADPSAALSFAGHLERNAQGRLAWPDTRALLEYPSPLVHLAAESFIHTLSVVVCRASAFRRLGFFDEGLRIVHDLDWYLRVVAAGDTIAHVPAPLVERTVPGGLVADHRAWFREEQAVLRRFFDESAEHSPSAPLVFAYRSLFFARVALARGDLAFGLRRLGAALATSTPWTLRIAARRLVRRGRASRRSLPTALSPEVR